MSAVGPNMAPVGAPMTMGPMGPLPNMHPHMGAMGAPPPTRSVSAGRAYAGPGPIRQGSAPAGPMRQSSTPLRQPIGWGSMPQVPGQRMPPQHTNSSSSIPVACEAFGNTSGAWSPPPGSPMLGGAGQCLGARSFSTPTGLSLGGHRPDFHIDALGSATPGRCLPLPGEAGHQNSYLPLAGHAPSQSPNMSWQPPATARGQDRSPSPCAGPVPTPWQFGGQSAPHTARAGWQFNGQTPRAGAWAPLTPLLQASPRELASAREEAMHTHRSTAAWGGVMPHSGNAAVTVAAQPVQPQHSAPSAHAPLFPTCFGGSASMPASAVPAYPAWPTQQVQAHSPAQPSFAPPPQPQQSSFAPPLQPQVQPPQTSQAMFATVDSVASVEEAPLTQATLDTQGELDAPEGVLSPRDTVWKRYFSGPKGASRSHSAEELPGADNLQVLTAAGSNTSHPGVPRLALQSAMVQVGRSESASGLANTERNTLPATERAAPIHMPATDRAAVIEQPATARASPSSPFKTVADRVTPLLQAGPSRFAGCLPPTPALPEMSKDENLERVRLSEADTLSKAAQSTDLEGSPYPVPPWRTVAIPAPWSQGVAVNTAPKAIAHEETCSSASTQQSGASALQLAMGQFGPPDAPVTIDMAPILSQRSQAGFQPSLPMPYPVAPSSDLLPVFQEDISHQEEATPQVSPALQASASPQNRSDEYSAQSFMVAPSPSQQSRNDETFMKPTGSWAPPMQPGQDFTEKQVAQAGREYVEKQLVDVPTPLRSHSTFLHQGGDLSQRGQIVQDSFQSTGAENMQPLQPRMRGLPGNSAIAEAPEQKAPVKAVERQETPGRKLQAALRQPVAVIKEEPTTAVELVAAAASAVTLRDLAELRSFRNPPVLVCQVLEPLAVLLGVSDTRWPKMRKLLDGNLLGRLLNFEPSQLTQMQVDRVECLLQAPAFVDGALHEKCPAAASLAAWCDAIMECVSMTPPPVPAAARMISAPSNVTACRPDLGGITVEPNIWAMSEAELSRVQGLRFTREGVGSIYFYDETDLRDVLPHLADVVLLQPGEVVVYPNPGSKPPAGTGLNKPAEITLFGCMPKTQGFRDQKAKERYRRRVKQMTENKGADFVDYDCTVGTWKFRVNHF